MDQSVLKLSIFSTDRRSSLQLSYFDEEEGKKNNVSHAPHTAKWAAWRHAFHGD